MKSEAIINLVLGGAIAVGFVWTQLKSLPRMEERINSHEVQIAVMRSDLSYIKQGVETLVRGSRRGSREP
jgi:hypothetical protein